MTQLAAEKIATTYKVIANEDDLNRDPISGTEGAHPFGPGAGAASGGVAGVVAGMAIGGPVGGVIGAAVGAVAGGLAGKSMAEAINPTEEEKYWRETCVREPYFTAGQSFEYYARGFRAGWEGRVLHDGATFLDAEPKLISDYNIGKSEFDPPWAEVRLAARSAWNRVDQAWQRSE